MRIDTSLPSRIEVRRCALLSLAAALIAGGAACGTKQDGAAKAPEAPPARTFVAGVQFSAEPNPIPVCDGSGTGVTTLRWTAPCPEGSFLEVRVGGAKGKVFARGGERSEATTGKWVAPGDVFALLLGSQEDGERKVLAELTVQHATTGCK